MESEECKNTLDLMQPEVLSVEVLRQVLSQRLVATELAETPKYALVELWHRLVTPLPQRVYPDSRAGRWYAARQRRPRAAPAADRDWNEISQAQPGTSSKSPAAPRVSAPGVSTAAPPSVSRLKPPPAAVTGEKRIIKLSSKRPAEGGLDDLVIKRRTSAGEMAHRPGQGAGGPNTAQTPKPNGSPGGDGGTLAKCAAKDAATVGETQAETGTAAENNGKDGSGDLACDIKAKLKLEKRKIKIRRKSSASEPEAKRVACDP